MQNPGKYVINEIPDGNDVKIFFHFQNALG